MKLRRLWIILLVLAMLLALNFCSKTRVAADQNVTLLFIYEDKNITATLTDEEAAKVIEILNGNTYDPTILFGSPSCGFWDTVALKVGDRTFSIASDGCNCIRDLGNLMYFDIPEEDMAYIHSLFEKYGGYFPCV
jgi:hypothetical protein